MGRGHHPAHANADTHRDLASDRNADAKSHAGRAARRRVALVRAGWPTQSGQELTYHIDYQVLGVGIAVQRGHHECDSLRGGAGAGLDLAGRRQPGRRGG